MLTQANIFSQQMTYYENPLELNFGVAAATDPVQVKNIEGLGPVKADINSNPYGTIDGEVLTGAALGKRNIIFTLGLNPDWADQTVEGLRQLLYAYVMPKSLVKIVFVSTHLPTCSITGIVEDMNPNIFSSDPEISISVLCGNPDFVSEETYNVGGLVIDDDLDDGITIDYVGTKPAGVNILVDKNVAHPTYTGELAFLSSSIFGSRKLTLDEVTVDVDHKVEVNSIPGNKYIFSRDDNLFTEDTYFSLLNRVVDNPQERDTPSGAATRLPQWPLLQPGENQIRVVAETAGQAFDLSYNALFGGL